MPKISKKRFDALAGYTRLPQVALICEELEWYTTVDERVLGLLARDRTDDDFSWVLLGRDRNLRFRAFALDTSIASRDDARAALGAKLAEHGHSPDSTFHQADEIGDPVDFFTPVVPRERFHRSFAMLLDNERYSPAREVITAMMRYHRDVDGNFVEQFQTTGFDARLWELYLYAVLVEMGYARQAEARVPDFLAEGLLGKLGIEAVTANPPQNGIRPPLRTDAERSDYLYNYIPWKLARGLKRKLAHRPPYWQAPGMADVPFLIGIQDFHASGSMRMIVPAATEYVFGYRHTRENDQTRITRIVDHRVGSSAEPSGFFTFPESENVSAVIVNPQGTLMKFNRMGFQAGFGSERVRMWQSGLLRREGYPDGPAPREFNREVTRSSEETWSEGLVVLHNPRARIPLEMDQMPGANHEFVEPDGRIMSSVPPFHPYFSQTQISLVGEVPQQPSE